jgi:aryl-alcohol dehydrogenase-like predicted oxidoreductase
MTLHQIPLGRTDLTVSSIGLGCNRFGATLGGCTGTQVERLVHGALDAGVILFDTADIYGQGDSERLLGAALRGRREGAVVVTKAGQCFSLPQRAAALAKAPLRRATSYLPGLRAAIAARRTAPLPRDFRPSHLRRAVEGSLRRLATDRLDVFLLHSPFPEDLRQGAAFEMLERLREAGKIRVWGVDCDDLATTEAALSVARASVVQVPLGLATSAYGMRALAAATVRGVGIFVRGLSGVVSDWAVNPAARREAISVAHGVPDAAAIVSTTRLPHLVEIVSLASRYARGDCDMELGT